MTREGKLEINPYTNLSQQHGIVRSISLLLWRRLEAHARIHVRTKLNSLLNLYNVLLKVKNKLLKIIIIYIRYITLQLCTDFGLTDYILIV